MFKPLKLNDNLTINDPVFLAPMAGITDLPYRKLIRKISPTAPLVTEMISSHSLVQSYKSRNRTNQFRNFDDYSTEPLIGTQIFGGRPDIMAESAKILEQMGAAWIDINMGCPVPKVATRAKAGAFLMTDHKLADEIINAVVKSVSIPVTIKTRLGWDAKHLDSSELVKIAADNGVVMAMIHGRTRAMGYSGTADWNEIQKIKNKSTIPIIGNGDIKNNNDAINAEKMNIDGIAIGRAIMGRPWLLYEIINGKKYETTPQILHDLILEHLDFCFSYYGIEAAVPLFRKHLAWYTAGISGSAVFRAHINTISNPNILISEINGFFK